MLELSVQGRAADAAGGNIDDPRQRRAVVRIVKDAQVEQQVLHLPSLVEANRAVDGVRDPCAGQGLLEGPGLEVGPVENRLIFQRRGLPVPQVAHLVDEPGSLVAIGAGPPVNADAC